MLVQTKLSLIYGLMAFFLLAISMVGIVADLSQQAERHLITQTMLPALTLLGELRQGLWRLVADTREAPQHIQALEAQLSEYQRISRAKGEMSGLSGEIRRRLLDLQERVGMESPEALMERAKSINALLDTATAQERQHLDAMEKRAKAEVRFRLVVSVTLLGTGVVLLLVAGFPLVRRIGDSLQEAYKASVAVSGGDLSFRLHASGEDEIGMLAESFNRMVDTLAQADAEITREVEERARAEQKAQAAARAKSDFLAHMSHEFRTPLNGILGYTQVLLMDKGLSEKNRGVVMSLRRSGEALLELINDVLDLAKIEARRMDIRTSRFYLHEFLQGIVESYAQQIALKGLEFRLVVDPAIPDDMLADPIRLRQVLVNLVGNAIKFTDSGRVELRVAPEGSGLRFSVADTGIGIDPADLDRIMQPFIQVAPKDRKHQGTGLGLSISDRLIQMMGGEGLKVRSEPGKGSEFWFVLPQPEGSGRRLVHAPGRVKGYKGERRRLLFAESSREVQGTLLPLLRKTGFEVVEAYNATELIQQTEACSPHLVIADAHLQGNGIEAMRKIRADGDKRGIPVPPFILFSDNRNENDQTLALSAGAEMFLSKPIRFADLLTAIGELLQLEWEEGKPEEGTPPPTTTPPPPAEEIQALWELARAGNIRQIRERVEALRANAPEHAPFCSSMLSLCSTYQIKAIQEMLRKFAPDNPEATS